MYEFFKFECMEDYKRPSMREESEQFVLHIGTNDLNSTLSTQFITESILNLATSLKTDSNNVSVSAFIFRMDNRRLTQK